MEKRLQLLSTALHSITWELSRILLALHYAGRVTAGNNGVKALVPEPERSPPHTKRDLGSHAPEE